MLVRRYFLTSVITVVLLLWSVFVQAQKSGVTLTAGKLDVHIDSKGVIDALIGKETGKDYLLTQKKSYLLSLRVGGEYLRPASMMKENEKITFHFPEELTVVLLAKQKNGYLTLSVENVKGEKRDSVELVVWGPYFTTINDTIGETVGVVRNDEIAIGIQSLNVKTMGGYPWFENDHMPEMDIFEQPGFDVYSKNKRYVLYRVEAAKPVAGGSSLQAYCRNRNRDRIVKNLGYSKYVAPAYHDGGVLGSEIALFGCAPAEVLPLISEIELQEGLPHTMIDGEWAKTSKKATEAYIIMDFGEKSIDNALEVVKKAGLHNLYHAGPFKTWGHFELLKMSFPHGVEGLKKCVEKANNQGVTLGVHTLSNFITRNDAYVTPVPDSRLAKVGSSVLSEKINTDTREIPIQSPEFFKEYQKSNLKTVVIGEELIRFRKLSDTTPWRLLDCQRGAYRTKAVKHQKGETVSLLADHAYKVFLTDAELTKEMAGNMADLFNKTGLTQISFDGLEGNQSTGLGVYGEALMPYTWYKNLNEKERRNIIVHSSRPTHFFWHIFTRLNWGEPWYAGFRESQTETRLKNQEYFKRNYIPGMLGWFSLREDLTPADMEWMLARSAAYDAGYAFVVSSNALKKNGRSDEILALIKQWEKARLSGAFPDSIKQEMKDIRREYHLVPIGENTWNLYRVKSNFIRHQYRQKQPGEPLFTTAEITNPFAQQSPRIVIKAIKDTDCETVSLEFDNYKTVEFPVSLKKEEFLVYKGGKEALLYDKNGNEIKKIPVSDDLILEKGDHTVNVDAQFLDGSEPAVKVEVNFISKPLVIKSKEGK